MSDDPLTMYLVVRKDVPRTLGQAMMLAGAGVARCAADLECDPRFAEAFGGWRERPRKVALRADPVELDELHEALASALEEPGLLCLPPMRKSDRPELLAALRPFTDAPRPSEARDPAPADEHALVYVIRPGVIRTTGKAMAQAGHAALMAVDRLGPALDGWRERGRPGSVRSAEGDVWERLRKAPDALVVRDAGLTQVKAGTETVIALPPGHPAAHELAPVP